MGKIRKDKGITLVALVVTIIVLIILAGISISLVLGNNGIITKAKQAKVTYGEAQAREKLEMVLAELQTDKLTKDNIENFNNEINRNIQENEMQVTGNVVLVGEWQFQIDRSVPKIIANLGRGEKEEQIQINMTSTTSTDYTKATIKIEITYEEEVTSISFNGEEIELPTKQNGTYVIEKEVKENGTYAVVAKNKEGKYNIESDDITDLTEDMDIWNIEDMIAFRNKVAEGRTFEGRTVRVRRKIDLSSACYRVDGTATNDISWTPIGTREKPFKGTLEGNGNEITNLYINNGLNEQGLFGYTTGATIKNVTLTNVNVTAGVFVAGMIGACDYTTLEACMIDENSTINGMGRNQYGTYVGGMIGSNDYGESSKIKKCINKATIYGVGPHVGGIIGYAMENIEECINTGNISSSADAVGGICGISNLGDLQVLNSYNTGNVTGTHKVGGILGVVVGVNVQNTYSIGIITNGSEIVGYAVGGTTITNCYGKNEEFNATILGDKYQEDIGINKGYPILRWQAK